MRIAPAALASALLLAGLGTASAAQDPSGTWLTGDGRAKIRIDRCGPGAAHVCGKVVWLKVPTFDDGSPRTDVKNPDPKKRARPVIGLPLIEGLKPDEEKFSGSIYNVDEGKTYQVSLERESEAELAVSGCLLKILCGSQTWTRVPDVNQQAAVAPAAEAAKPKAKASAEKAPSVEKAAPTAKAAAAQ